MRTFRNRVIRNPKYFDPKEVKPIAGLGNGQGVGLIAMVTSHIIKPFNFNFSWPCTKEENHFKSCDFKRILKVIK